MPKFKVGCRVAFQSAITPSFNGFGKVVGVVDGDGPLLYEVEQEETGVRAMFAQSEVAAPSNKKFKDLRQLNLPEVE